MVPIAKICLLIVREKSHYNGVQNYNTMKEWDCGDTKLFSMQCILINLPPTPSMGGDSYDYQLDGVAQHLGCVGVAVVI